MPLRRTLTGCRCRKVFESTASVRLRGVSGYPWRKTERQIWVSRTAWRSFCIARGEVGTGGLRLIRQVGAVQRPLPLLLLVLRVLVDQDLAVLGHQDLVALERTRR